MSTKRKRLVGWALGLAIWSTLGWAVIFSGALQEIAATKGDELIGRFAGFLIGIPSIIGGALGMACLDKRLGNPPIVWVAAIWNVILLAVWLLLSIVGTCA